MMKLCISKKLNQRKEYNLYSKKLRNQAIIHNGVEILSFCSGKTRGSKKQRSTTTDISWNHKKNLVLEKPRYRVVLKN